MGTKKRKPAPKKIAKKAAPEVLATGVVMEFPNVTEVNV